MMRPREEIQTEMDANIEINQDFTAHEAKLLLEVLLDIRDQQEQLLILAEKPKVPGHSLNFIP